MTAINRIKRNQASILMLMILSLFPTVVLSNESTDSPVNIQPNELANEAGTVKDKAQLLDDDELSDVNFNESPSPNLSFLQENTSIAIKSSQTKFLFPDHGYHDTDTMPTISFLPDKPIRESPEAMIETLGADDALQDLMLPEDDAIEFSAIRVQRQNFIVVPVIENVAPRKPLLLPDSPAKLEPPKPIERLPDSGVSLEMPSYPKIEP